jgi:hypothetical protein
LLDDSSSLPIESLIGTEASMLGSDLGLTRLRQAVLFLLGFTAMTVDAELTLESDNVDEASELPPEDEDEPDEVSGEISSSSSSSSSFGSL